MSNYERFRKNTKELHKNLDFDSMSTKDIKRMYDKISNKNKELESQFRDKEFQQIKLEQKHQIEKAQLLAKIEDLENQAEFYEKSEKKKNQRQETESVTNSNLIEQFEQKLSDYENEIINLKENETKLNFELSELKHANDSLKLKYDKLKQQSIMNGRRLTYDDKQFNKIISSGERLSTLAFVASSPKKLATNIKDNDSKDTKGDFDTVSSNNSLINELQIQLQEMKDRAISSLVEKEKNIIRLTQSYDKKIQSLQDELELVSKMKKTSKSHDPQVSMNQINLDELQSDYNLQMYKIEIEEYKQKLNDSQKEKNSIIKKSNIEYQALMTKYEEDIAFYKQKLEDQAKTERVIDFDESIESSRIGDDSSIIDNMIKNEEIYIENEAKHKAKIKKLQEQVSELRSLLSEQEATKKTTNQEIPPQVIHEVDNQIYEYEDQIKELRKNLKEKTKQLQISSDELHKVTISYEDLTEKHESLEIVHEKLVKELKEANSQLSEQKTQHLADIEIFEKEMNEKKEAYDNAINSLKLEIANKDTTIKIMNEQFLDLDEIEHSIENSPFETVDTSGLESSSLFEELGGDTGGRSMSILPKNYKNLTKE